MFPLLTPRRCRAAVLAIALGGLTACSAGDGEPMAVVQDFDAQRYMGDWHEIATIPASFQDDCTGPAQAHYELDNLLVHVTNRCATGPGTEKTAKGLARFAGPPTEGKLEVTFVDVGGWWMWQAAGRYWIIGLDRDYRWSVVGEPGRDYAWILAREGALPDRILERAATILRDAGYDTCDLIVTSTAQAPGRPELCALAPANGR
jgi:apolipoprotein D and lipocalin family protein